MAGQLSFLSGKNPVLDSVTATIIEWVARKIGEFGLVKDLLNQSILFADIGGSSAFYHQVGDSEAKNAIDQIFQALNTIVNNCRGKVIKTIGDEVMCAFPSADLGVKTAIMMQTQLAAFLKRHNLVLNIGIGFGQVIKDKADLFGNVVNETAHLTYMASGGQILVTESCFNALSKAFSGLAREYDQVTFKGAAQQASIYRIYWQDDRRHGSETQLVQADIIAQLDQEALKLKCHDKVITIQPNETPFILGRDPSQCDLVIQGVGISRKHCHISYRRGKYVLVDHSTNGCYLLSDGKTIYLRREDHSLLGKMILSLGIPVEQATNNLLELTC